MAGGGVIAMVLTLITILLYNNIARSYLDVAIVECTLYRWHHCNGSDNNLWQRTTQLLSLALSVPNMMIQLIKVMKQIEVNMEAEDDLIRRSLKKT